LQHNSQTFGRAIHAACQWGLISVLARIGSPEIVGEYALGVAVAGPLLLLARRRSSPMRSYQIRVVALAFALLGVAAVGFVGQTTQDRLAILVVVMSQSAEWIAEFYLGGRDAISLAAHGCLPVAALVTFSNLSGRVTVGLLGVLIVRLLILFFYDFRQPPRSEQEEGRESVLASFAMNVPSYFIAHMMGYRWLGIYFALSALFPAVHVLAGAVAEEAVPELTRRYGNADFTGFRRLTVQLAGSGLLLGLSTVAAALTIGPWLLERLFGVEYSSQAPVLVALAAVAGGRFVATLLGNGGPKAVAPEIISITVIAMASVMLIPRFGLMGAAIATGAGYVARTASDIRTAVLITRRC
jgi:hypothetical protein